MPHAQSQRYQVPIVYGAKWGSGPVWMIPENLTPPDFDTWTVQSVASHYRDYAIPDNRAHQPPLQWLVGITSPREQ